jgi:phenylacetate-CoA ligase
MRLSMHAFFSAIERRLIKARLAAADPESLIRSGEKWLLPAFRRAARACAAYRVLLAEAGVDPESVRTVEDFVARCPVLEKANTFRRFPLAELLCDDVRPEDLASIITSSGHGGNGFAFGLSSKKQQRDAARLIDLGLDLAFDVGRCRTLLVNCLPMGVTFTSNLVCIANVSVREDMACAIVDKAGPLFEQIILCGDPLFLKKLCDYSQDIGLDWRRFRIHVIVGEETFPETFRDYLAGVLGIDPDDPASGLIGSSMGVGELGLNLFNETRETIALRRACSRDPELSKNLTGQDSAVSPAPTFMVFNPLRTFVEVIDPDEHGVGDLVVTVMDEKAPVPLMRYATGDRLQFIDRQRLAALAPVLPLPSAPVVALHGRAKDRLPGGGHVDLFKEAIYSDPLIARHLSGAHHISLCGDRLLWEIQSVRDISIEESTVVERLQTLLSSKLLGTVVEVHALRYDQFPYGKTIDYERKFDYLGRQRPGGLATEELSE